MKKLCSILHSSFDILHSIFTHQYPRSAPNGSALPWLSMNEWLREEGRVEHGKRSWARKVYEVMFSAARGYW